MESVDKTTKEQLVQSSFLMPKSLHKKFKEIAAREERDMRDILNEQVQEYVKIHGSGNPSFKLDNWQEPDFKMCPALFSKSDKWIKYFQSLNHDEKTNFEKQIQMLVHTYERL